MPSESQRSRSAGQASSSSRPSNSWLPATISTGTGQSRKRSSAGPGAVDVAAEHQQFGGRVRLGLEGLGLEVQVGEQLDPHQRSAVPAQALPWHCLNFLPLPQGQGSLRPTLGASRLTVSTL